jgi:glycine cleavage system H lipoate-binding protein
MKKKVSKKQDAESADAQNRCIWMTAGVISFKLCPFDYDCEHCDLDKAMRSQVKSRKIGSKVKKHRLETLMPSEKHTMSKKIPKKPFPFFTFSAGEMEEGFYLYPAHLWAKRIEGQKWRVGVDELLAYILPPPEKFEFHDLDKDLIQDQMFGKIRTQAGTVLLTAPLSGHLIQTNPRLARFPELAQKDPYGEGWLAIIKWNQNRSELQKFYTQNSGKRYLEEEAQHLKFLLKHRGVEVNGIGETLPDGGVNIKHLHQILPAKVCLRLAVELMVTGKQAW